MRAQREQEGPTLEQMRSVIETMPNDSEIERRNRALVAFALLTGARDSAIASLQLKHIDLVREVVTQDPREVKTKFAKRIITFFFPVGESIRQVVVDWVRFLREEKLWGDDDPLFPATQIAVGHSHQFEVAGLKRENWANAGPIRKVFRESFTRAGLPYFNPHSLRKTLARLGEQLCGNAEDLKAWSQNLGHESVLTTLTSYGSVATDRQGEIIRGLGVSRKSKQTEAEDIAEALFRRLRLEGAFARPDAGALPA